MPSEPRREFLRRTGCGLGGVALAALLADEARADGGRAGPAIDPVTPLAPRPPRRPATAKRVIHLFMWGGPGHVDTFDHKPELLKLAGKPVPGSFRNKGDKGDPFAGCKDELLAGPWKWVRHGQSGRWVSDLFPRTAGLVDDICFVHSMTADSGNHGPAMLQWNTGVTLPGKASMGAWVTYGLGTESQNLPGYVVLYKVAPLGGPPQFASAFLPAAFQGTVFRTDGPPVLHATPPAHFAGTQRATLDLAQEFNRAHAAARPGRTDLDGRIAAYELAYRMQAAALEVGDLTRESKETLDLYGVGAEPTDAFARMCLQARRLSERGVRVVQVYSAVDKDGWDGHDDGPANHRKNAAVTDRPVAALLTDLKRRGLLDDTLVIWSGEFGRTPMLQGKAGRNHNPWGYTCWLAGGGVTGGTAVGATDAIGLRAVGPPTGVKDLHATVLTALGLVPDDLSFEVAGRPERLTGIAGGADPIPGVLRRPPG